VVVNYYYATLILGGGKVCTQYAAAARSGTDSCAIPRAIGVPLPLGDVRAVLACVERNTEILRGSMISRASVPNAPED
jgi:hypothetical protein